MVKRFNELWGKALDKAVPETYSQLSDTQLSKALDAYALLIMEECISIINKRKDAAIDADWLVDEAMSNAVWDIEEHFGARNV